MADRPQEQEEKARNAIHALAVGVNHRSSTLALRDRLFVEERDVPAFLARLKDAGLSQSVVLSTCDRVEVQAVLPDGAMTEADAITAIKGALASHGEVGVDALADQVYAHAGPDALRHIFAVAASLDSQMVGEPQVLGQVKDGLKQAHDAGHVGPALDHVMQAAFQAAKRVRTETTIGERPVSIASAAVQVARDLFGDLDSCSTLLVGAGDMGTMIVSDLREAGMGALSVTHRTDARADVLARTLNCHAVRYENLADALASADIVLAALGARHRAITAAMVSTALKARKAKPQFLIDTAVPGDIEAAVGDLDDAFLYDLGDLERIAMEGQTLRKGEAEKAHTILNEEVDRFVLRRAERVAVPVLNDLRDRFETLRDEALKDAGGDAEKAARLFMKRALHGPFEVLRERAAAGGDYGELERALRDLFDLK